MKKRPTFLDDVHITHYLHITIILFTLILGLFLFTQFNKHIGFAVIDTTAGSITTLVLTDKSQTNNWMGYYGIAGQEDGYNESQSAFATPGGLEQNQLFFDCLSPFESVHEVYAAPNQTLDFSNPRPAPLEWVNEYLNMSGVEADSPNNTFTQTINISVGSTVVATPGMYTYVNDLGDSTYFSNGVLNLSGDIVFVGTIRALSSGFANQQTKYQMLVGTPNGSTRYYFFRDPNDECPEGFGSGNFGDGIIQGYVTDDLTGLPIVNATVAIGGVINYTDATGFYNITSRTGNQSFVAIKAGYLTNVSIQEINLTTTIINNVSLKLFEGLQAGEINFGLANLSGYVVDNATNTTISGAIVNIQGAINYTDSNGFYNFTSLINGTHNIYSVATGYSNFVENVTLLSNITGNVKNISLTVIQTPGNASGIIILQNGTVNGTVYENDTGLVVPNATIAIGGQIVTSNASGKFTMSVYEGQRYLVGLKSGYSHFVTLVNISENVTTTQDVYLANLNATDPEAGASGDNGTLTGLVLDNVTLARIENATISVNGVDTTSNSLGNYSLNLSDGTHNLIATKSGYEVSFAEVNVTANATTFYNVSMGQVETTGEADEVEAGGETSAGGGASAATETTRRFPPVEQGEKYIISIKRILKKLRIGSYTNVPLEIQNTGSDTINIQFELTGEVLPYIEMSKTSMSIEPDGSDVIDISIFAKGEPAVYSGELLLTGDIEQEIPIDLLFYQKEKLPIEALIVKITAFKKIISLGSKVRYRVDMQNLLREEEYRVFFTHLIENVDTGDQIILDEDLVSLKTASTLLKALPIPDDIEPGSYLLKVQAEYIGNHQEHTVMLKVVKPFYRYAILGVPLWIIFLVIGLTGAGTFGTVLYQKQKRKKQRYKGEVNLAKIPKAGPRSAYVGKLAEQNVKAYMDLDKFQIHTLLAGSSGSGKTIGAKVMVEEALMKGVAVVVFDPSGQWTGFLRKNEDKEMLAQFPKYNMKVSDAKGFSGNIHQVENPLEVFDFKKFMKAGEVNIFITNKLDTKGTEIFAANTIKEVFRANMPEEPLLKYLMIYDGVHALLPKYGGTGKLFTQLERATREFRKWGVGVILLSQVLSDFPAEVLANINTEVMMRTRDENDLKKITEEYGEHLIQSLVKAGVGAGMLENAAYNTGKPYFINFRPILHSAKKIPDEQIVNYNKYNKIVDNIDYSLEQLKENGLDIFDFQLELKLAKDKIKSGNFNMVGIYLDGLKPRIEKEWEKLGKKPKPYVVKLAKPEDDSEKAAGAKKPASKPKAPPKKAPPKKKPVPPANIPLATGTPAPGGAPAAGVTIGTGTQVIGEGQPIPEGAIIVKKGEGFAELTEDVVQLIERLQQLQVYASLNRKDKALQCYDIVRKLYTNLTKEQKKEVFPHYKQAMDDLRKITQK